MTLDQPNMDFESLIAEFKRLMSMVPDRYGDLKEMVARLEAEKTRGAGPCDLRSLLSETASRFKDALLQHSIIPSKRAFDEPQQRIDSCCAKRNQEELRAAMKVGPAQPNTP